MSEIFENALQTGILLFCTGIAFGRAAAGRSRIWTLAVFFFGSWALGDIYWLACLIFYGSSPQISLVSNLSWYAAFIFLYMLLREASPPEKGGKKSMLLWIGPVFAAVSAVFFMQWGNYLGNLITAALMGLLLYSVVFRLMNRERYRKQYFLAAVVLLYILLEYALWFSSCFWEYTFASPYFWCDTLLSLSFLLFLPATRKAAAV